MSVKELTDIGAKVALLYFAIIFTVATCTKKPDTVIVDPTEYINQQLKASEETVEQYDEDYQNDLLILLQYKRERDSLKQVITQKEIELKTTKKYLKDYAALHKQNLIDFDTLPTTTKDSLFTDYFKR